MRKVVLQMQVTLDGFVGGPDGEVDWAFRCFDDDFTAWTLDSLWGAGVHIMGGNTGRGLAAYWPSEEIEERDRPFAAAMNEIPRSCSRRRWTGSTGTVRASRAVTSSRS